MSKVQRTDIRVRYAETDKMGYVHHSQYAVYMEMGRTEALRAAGLSYADIEASGRFLVVARLALRFRAPARYDDVLVVETAVGGTTAARIEHTYRISRKDDGALLTDGETTLACVDADGRQQRIPRERRRLFQQDG